MAKKKTVMKKKTSKLVKASTPGARLAPDVALVPTLAAVPVEAKLAVLAKAVMDLQKQVETLIQNQKKLVQVVTMRGGVGIDLVAEMAKGVKGNGGTGAPKEG